MGLIWYYINDYSKTDLMDLDDGTKMNEDKYLKSWVDSHNANLTRLDDAARRATRTGFSLTKDGNTTDYGADRDAFRKALANERADFKQSSKGKSATLSEIREIAKKATECDQIIYETHTVSNRDSRAVIGLLIGGDLVSPMSKGYSELAEAFKETKAQYKIVIGSCLLTQEGIQDFANKAGHPAAGSGDEGHHIVDPSIDYQRDKFGMRTQGRFDVEVQTPYGLQTFKASPTTPR
jgi:hypothetical protein